LTCKCFEFELSDFLLRTYWYSLFISVYIIMEMADSGMLRLVEWLKSTDISEKLPLWLSRPIASSGD
jgi:hypothetical protein